MTLQRIPPRQDFDVSEQVYDWFRTLHTAIDKQSSDDQDESINTLLGFLKGIEGDFNELKSTIDTTELLSAKIQKLDEAISLLPEESDISLYKAFSMSFSVVTKEYTGSFAGTNLAVVIDAVNTSSAECLVEIRTTDTSGNNDDGNVTSRFSSSTSVTLERNGATGDIFYVLKVKEYK